MFEGEAGLVVPYFDFGVVRTSDDIRFRGVHNNSSDEVIVGIKSLDLLHGVVVEDPNLKIIRTRKNPLFVAEELDSPNWKGGGLKRTDTGLK